MKKIQKIPESKKIRGARVVFFCSKCKRDLTGGICHETKEDRCAFGETNHSLKYYLYVPGGDTKRVAKVLHGVTDINEANRIAINDKELLKNGKLIKEPVIPPPAVPPPAPLPVIETPTQEEQPLLKDLLARHLDVLADFNVPTHLKKNLSKDYQADISRGYIYLSKGLVEAGHDLNSFTVASINDAVVGNICDHLRNAKGLNFSDRSFSKYMQYYSTFLDWCIDDQGLGRINYFKKVPKKTPNYTPEVISKEVFDQLIEKITPENGIEIRPNKKKPGKFKRRYMFKPWLSRVLKVALETGRRRPEIVNMKWGDIHTKDSTPIYIKVADSKVNNIMKLSDSEKKFVYVPVTSGLYELIKEGYENYLLTKQDGYIVAPEITERREEKMCDAMSRGFAHYYKLVNPNEDEQLEFGCLRKTYLTSMELHTKGETEITALVSGHGSGGKMILNRHYIDPKAVASVNASKGFNVFPTENNVRNEELTKIREKGKGAEKTPER